MSPDNERYASKSGSLFWPMKIENIPIFVQRNAWSITNKVIIVAFEPTSLNNPVLIFPKFATLPNYIPFQLAYLQL